MQQFEDIDPEMMALRTVVHVLLRAMAASPLTAHIVGQARALSLESVAMTGNALERSGYDAQDVSEAIHAAVERIFSTGRDPAAST